MLKKPVRKIEAEVNGVLRNTRLKIQTLIETQNYAPRAQRGPEKWQGDYLRLRRITYHHDLLTSPPGL
jgi:hypothetical protein